MFTVNPLSLLLFAATLTGTVTHSEKESVYLQSGVRAMKVVFAPRAKTQLPTPGDIVVIKGESEKEGVREIFRAKSWRKTGFGALPKAVRADQDQLTSYEKNPDNDVNWHLVEIEGRAIGLTERGFVMKMGELPLSVLSQKLPPFMSDCGETRPKVRVTGIAELVLDPTSQAAPYVMGVKILVDRESNVVLEEDLSYLINRRDRRVRLAYFSLLALAAVLVVLLILFLLHMSRKQLRSKTLMAERKRMADDLHDTIEQHLVGAGMLLQLGKNAEARDILVRTKREMRDIVWGLKNDDMMRLKPAEMIRELAAEENRKGICRVDTRLKDMPSKLGAAEMRDLSLIVREAIGNAVKHGAAKRVAIASDLKEAGGWTLRISNDGAPFDAENAPGAKEGHFGLDGMRQRARRLKADMTIGLVDGRTVVKLETL